MIRPLKKDMSTADNRRFWGWVGSTVATKHLGIHERLQHLAGVIGELEARGYHFISMEVERYAMHPVIWVAPKPGPGLHHPLPSVHTVQELTDGKRIKFQQARFLGCRVQWRVP